MPTDTELHKAAHNGDLGKVKQLIEDGEVEVNEPGAAERRALHRYAETLNKQQLIHTAKKQLHAGFLRVYSYTQCANPTVGLFVIRSAPSVLSTPSRCEQKEEASGTEVLVRSIITSIYCTCVPFSSSSGAEKSEGWLADKIHRRHRTCGVSKEEPTTCPMAECGRRQEKLSYNPLAFGCGG